MLKIHPEKIPLVDRHGIVRFRNIRYIAQPQQGSQWPALLVDDSWGPHVAMLSDDYLNPDKTNLPGVCSSNMMAFLSDLLGAQDIPSLPMANLPLPGLPKTLQDRDSALLLLEWVSCNAINRYPNFLKSIQSYAWVETACHGWKQPTSCLLLDNQEHLLCSDAPICTTLLDVPGSKRMKLNDALLALGVGGASQSGAQIVAQHLFHLSTPPGNQIDLGAATCLYLFLEKFHWNGSMQGGREIFLKVLVPPANWVDVKRCVVSDRHGMFEDILSVLDKYYKSEALLAFFADILKVPKVPTVDHYFLLWLHLTGMRPGQSVKLSVIERVRKEITANRASCDKLLWEQFLHTGQVPFVSAGEAAGEVVDVAPAPATFWADNLQVVHAFATDCTEEIRPKMVWIPKSYSTLPLHELYLVYVEMGVQQNSRRVKSEIISTSGKNASLSTPISRGKGLVTKGLLRAVLIFLCQPEHKIPEHKRQQMVKSLAEVSEHGIRQPYQLKYVLELFKGREVVSVQEQMVHWETHLDSAKLTYLQNEQRNKMNLISRLNFGSQLVKAIVYGVVGEYPHVAEKLEDFLPPAPRRLLPPGCCYVLAPLKKSDHARRR